MVTEATVETLCIPVDVKVGMITIGGLFASENEAQKLQGSKFVVLGQSDEIKAVKCEGKPIRLRLNGQVLPVELLAGPQFFDEVQRLHEAKKIRRIQQADGYFAISEKFSMSLS